MLLVEDDVVEGAAAAGGARAVYADYKAGCRNLVHVTPKAGTLSADRANYDVWYLIKPVCKGYPGKPAT